MALATDAWETQRAYPPTTDVLMSRQKARRMAGRIVTSNRVTKRRIYQRTSLYDSKRARMVRDQLVRLD